MLPADTFTGAHPAFLQSGWRSHKNTCPAGILIGNWRADWLYRLKITFQCLAALTVFLLFSHFTSQMYF